MRSLWSVSTLALVVSVDQLEQVEKLLAANFRVERFPHGLNVSANDSKLRVQIQTDPRYFEFPERASAKDVLGLQLPVADITDLLDGKICAALDPARREVNRRRARLDTPRCLNGRPALRCRVPPEL